MRRIIVLSSLNNRQYLENRQGQQDVGRNTMAHRCLDHAGNVCWADPVQRIGGVDGDGLGVRANGNEYCGEQKRS